MRWGPCPHAYCTLRPATCRPGRTGSFMSPELGDSRVGCDVSNDAAESMRNGDGGGPPSGGSREAAEQAPRARPPNGWGGYDSPIVAEFALGNGGADYFNEASYVGAPPQGLTCQPPLSQLGLLTSVEAGDSNESRIESTSDDASRFFESETPGRGDNFDIFIICQLPGPQIE